MAKQVNPPKQNIPTKNPPPGIKTDLIHILIGMAVMILFIAGLVFLIGALLK